MPKSFERILNEFPRDTKQQIKNRHIPQKKVTESGIELVASDEIFVRLPGRMQDYAISSYSRFYSMKNGEMRYIPPSYTNDYEEVSLYLRPDNRKRYPKGEQRTYTIHALMAIAFLPNYWEGTTKRRQMRVFHCDHDKGNNFWKNLVLLPAKLCKPLTDVKQVWLRGPGKQQFRRRTYYEIAELTGESLEAIISLIRKVNAPDFVAKQGDKELRCFAIGNYEIGFEMMEMMGR